MTSVAGPITVERRNVEGTHVAVDDDAGSIATPH